jgi:hypothetical protein
MRRQQKATARARVPKPAAGRAADRPPPADYTDDTGPRILAFLASMRPLRGALVADGEDYQRGREVIELLAARSRDTDSPGITLSVRQCADALHFLAQIEPTDPQTWWKDPKDAPSHVCGLQMVLLALEDSLRLG